ncbi:MAG: DUF3078 domain-containing protein [Salinivirgaceae bacterium]|jgi:hypothetical protein|nr:DUF3078 domain-containing protein [Salinivirgaceae bacterium]
MRLLVTVCLFILSASLTLAQETGENNELLKDTVWRFEGQSSFNFTQGFLENWTQGGENFLSGIILNDYTLSYDKEKSSWENNMSYKLGATQQGEERLRKNEDLFDFSSKYGYDLSNKNIFFTNIISFKTQMFKGFDYANDNDSIAISRFLNPGHIVIATGFEYKYKKILSAMASPLSGKVTLMTDTAHYDPVAFGIDEGENFRAEMGAYVKIKFKKEVVKNVNLSTTLELFNNYFSNPENIDIDWQTTITFNVNKYIKTTIFAHVIYDDDVPIPLTGGRTTRNFQIKETLGIGLAYSINKYK